MKIRATALRAPMKGFGRNGLAAMSIPLDRNGNADQRQSSAGKQPMPPKERNQQRNVARHESRHEDDVQQQIRARLVVARISPAWRTQPL